MGQPLRVLIIEDSEEDAQLVLRELRRGGYEVEFERVETEVAMRAMLIERPWDLILSDYNLPKFNAPQALEILKASGLDIPFIIISGTIGEETAVAALKAGANDFLVKGKFARLGPAIERELGDAKTRREHRQADEKLIASETRYRRLFESAKDGILILDAESGLIVDVNPFLITLLGYTHEALLGKNIWELGFFKDNEANKANFLELQQKEYIRYADLPLETANGRRINVEFVSNVYRVNHHRVIQCNIRDITERKQAEEQVNYHARLLRHINDAVIATDDQIRITAWNRAAERIYGWTATEVMGRSLDEVLRGQLNREQQAQAKELLQESGSLRSERIHAKRNGQPVYVEENMIALTDQRGVITGYVTVNRDITERKQAEEIMRENERLLSESQSIGHVGSWSYNLVMDSLQYSDEMYRILDVSPREFPHTSEGFLNLIYPSDHPLAVQWMEDIRIGRQPRELEFRIFRKNGELRYIQCTGAIIFSSTGKPVRFTGMAQDITERKQAEIQIRQQLEHLSALRKIDQAIASNFDLRFTLNTLLTEARTQLQVDAADILLLNPEEQVLEYAAGQGFRTHAVETARVPMGKSYAGRVAKEQRLIKFESLEYQSDDPILTTLLTEENFLSYFGLPLIAKGKVKGVLEVFHRVPLHPYSEWLDFLNTLAGQAAIAIENTTLFENLQQSNRELSQAYDATIEGWSRALDLRDKETEGHTQRVTEMTNHLARRFDFTEEELSHMRWGALLHDIGKMGVPDNILLKPEPLTETEWITMRKHPEYAYDVLKPIDFLAPALDIPYYHHEKWDGTGYPRGMKGEEIPMAARLFAVVDVWDALRSDRPYRPAWSEEETLVYIREQAGRHFDPQVVEAFLKMIE